MKAIIVKDNNFETIGFEVTESGRLLFSWGISSCLKSNFQKEIVVKEWMSEIFELVATKAKIEAKSDFTRSFFSVACSQGFVKDGQPVDLSENKQEIEGLKQRMENIIKNII